MKKACKLILDLQFNISGTTHKGNSAEAVLL